jgi:integrase
MGVYYAADRHHSSARKNELGHGQHHTRSLEANLLDDGRVDTLVAVRVTSGFTDPARRTSALVFTKAGKPVKQTSTRAWRDALEATGIEDFRWRDLRHASASWHVQNGTELPVLQELDGWLSLNIVQRYAHPSGEHLRAWAERRSLQLVAEGGTARRGVTSQFGRTPAKTAARRARLGAQK